MVGFYTAAILSGSPSIGAVRSNSGQKKVSHIVERMNLLMQALIKNLVFLWK